MTYSPVPYEDNRYPVRAPEPPAAGAGSSGRLGRYVLFLRRYWWIPSITLLLGLAGAWAAFHWVEPQYTSTATMWEPEKLTLPGGASFNDNSVTYLGTQIELLRSGEMAQRTLARIQSLNPKSIPLGKDGRPPVVAIGVKEVPKSKIFQIEATSPIPAYSQAYLDALLNVYLDYKKNIRKTVSGDTLASISEQVLRMESELKQEQAALTSYEQSNNLAVLEEEGRVAGAYLAKLQTELSDLRLDSEMLAASEKQVMEEAARTNTASASSATNDAASTNGSRGLEGSRMALMGAPNQLSPEEEIEMLRLQRAKLSKNLRPKHPKIVKLDEQIATDEKLVELARSRNLKQMNASYESAKWLLLASIRSNQSKASSVITSIKEWEQKVTDANRRVAEADKLKLDVARTQTVYDRLTQMLQNVDISRNIEQDTMSVLGSASLARRSLAKEILAIQISVFAGLAVGFGLVYLITIRDDRFNSISEVNDRFGDVIVGQVPEVPLLKGPSGGMEVFKDASHMSAESYRNLRSAIFFMPAEEKRPKILVVTSAIPGEGKSTVVSNLARTLAQGGSRVLLVDADFRKGYLHKVLSMRSGPGFAEYLEGKAEFNEVLQRDGFSSFYFISHGNPTSNPGDLFIGPTLSVAFAKFREEFDYVLVDTSPVFAADDSPTLAPQADATLFVVRNRFSSAGVVKEALDLLAQRQVKVIGLVFNGADAENRSYYYYKHEDYQASNNAEAE